MKKAAVSLALIVLAGCSTFHFPGVHRITIQQGNVVTQAMVDKLRPGMTRSQVRFVMGNPIVQDPLDKNRWDYYYSIKIGDKEAIRRELNLYFVNDRLSYFVGDFLPTKQRDRIEGDSKKG